jgi:hypothetical protein
MAGGVEEEGEVWLPLWSLQHSVSAAGARDYELERGKCISPACITDRLAGW